MPSKSLLTILAFVSATFATNVHVNQGCIDVNDSPICASNSISVDGGAATIYARFDSGNQYPTAVPGCTLQASWPSSYGDIYFGADNCLYDANSQNINGQCCEPGSGGTTAVTNPYA